MNLVIYILGLRRYTLVTRVYLLYHARFPSNFVQNICALVPQCIHRIHKLHGKYGYLISLFVFFVYLIWMHFQLRSIFLFFLFIQYLTFPSKFGAASSYIIVCSFGLYISFFFCAVISNLCDIFSRNILPTAMILYLNQTQLSTLVSLVLLGWVIYSDKHCMNIRVLSMC